MHRWTARFLVLAMVVPAFGPLALAGTGASTAMSCHRQPIGETAQAASPATHCHHGMASTPRPETTSDALYAVHSCCENHDCCCRLKTSEWARPAAKVLVFTGLWIKQASPRQLVLSLSGDLFEIDSARAPPLL
jgi:hypothetical protein